MRKQWERAPKTQQIEGSWCSGCHESPKLWTSLLICYPLFIYLFLYTLLYPYIPFFIYPYLYIYKGLIEKVNIYFTMYITIYSAYSSNISLPRFYPEHRIPYNLVIRSDFTILWENLSRTVLHYTLNIHMYKSNQYVLNASVKKEVFLGIYSFVEILKFFEHTFLSETILSWRVLIIKIKIILIYII